METSFDEQGHYRLLEFTEVQTVAKTRKENGDPAYEGVHHRTGRKDL